MRQEAIVLSGSSIWRVFPKRSFTRSSVDKPEVNRGGFGSRGDNKLEVSKDLDLSRVLSVPVGDGQPIHTMVALGHSEVWFSSLSNTKQIQLFGIDGRIEKPLNLDFSVKDMSVSRTSPTGTDKTRERSRSLLTSNLLSPRMRQEAIVLSGSSIWRVFPKRSFTRSSVDKPEVNRGGLMVE
jgi:hypothetical protein